MKTVVRGGTVVNASHSGPADVLVDGEEIVAVGRLGDVDANEIDASGCVVLPGLIDNHTHMSMPFQGTRSCDDYDTGTRAAAAGGVTCIVDFALQMEPGGLQSSLQEWQDRARGAAHVDYGFHMAITKADEETLADMERIVELGVPSFKVFLAYPGELMVADDLFLHALERARDLGGFIMVHAENGMAIDHLVQRARREGRMEPINHALTRPEEMEAEATSRAVRLAEFAGAPVYIVHVSCKRAAEEVEAGAVPRRPRGGRDVRAVPVHARSTTSTARTSRARATSARRRCATASTSRTCGRFPGPRRARERLDRPLPVQLRAEGDGARRLLEDPQRPGGHPAPAREDVGARRARGAHDARADSWTSARPRSRAASGSSARAPSRRGRTPTS